MWSYLNKHWFAAYLACTALCSITLFYVPLHLVLGIPPTKLLEPYGAFCLVSLPTARGIYWAQPILVNKDDARPLYLVMSLYAAFLYVLVVFYGETLGFFDQGNSARNYLLAVSFGLFPPWVGYYLWRKFIRPKKNFPLKEE